MREKKTSKNLSFNHHFYHYYILHPSILLNPSTEKYLLKNSEWKNDIIPEIVDSKNIADFIDPDIEEKLNALEREEERLMAEGHYDSEEEMVKKRIHHPSQPMIYEAFTIAN